MSPKSKMISCKNCGAKNSLKKAEILNLTPSLICKACEEELFFHQNRPFDHLSQAAFVHDLDRQMLEALQKIPGISSLLKGLLRHSFELSMRLHHQGNFVLVSKKQARSLYEKLEKAAHILAIKDLPELYIIQDARVNAYTFGVEKCSIAISSGCLELLTDDEVTSVLAHELGHIKANHVLYKTASRILATLADSLAQKTLGLGGLMLYPMKIALLRWDRASELSSDRASLLVVKKPLTVLNSLMKLAGGSPILKGELNINAFIEQAEGYEKTQEEGPLGKYLAIMSSMFNSHPFPIWRAREILDWVDSGEYFKILQGDYAREDETAAHFCRSCGNKQSDGEKYCSHCDGDKSDRSKPYGEKIDKAWGDIKSWYDKNFKAPENAE